MKYIYYQHYRFERYIYIIHKIIQNNTKKIQKNIMHIIYKYLNNI